MEENMSIANEITTTEDDFKVYDLLPEEKDEGSGVLVGAAIGAGATAAVAFGIWVYGKIKNRKKSKKGDKDGAEKDVVDVKYEDVDDSERSDEE